MADKKIQFSGELGERVLQRLEHEIVIWLTTVSKDGTPQPNPVWFLWDGETILIYSQPDAAKVHNITRSPKVSLHFEGADVVGGDVIVLTGEARVDLHSGSIPQGRDPSYKHNSSTGGTLYSLSTN